MWRLPTALIPTGSNARYVSHDFQRYLALDGSTIGPAEMWAGADRQQCITLTQVLHLQGHRDGAPDGAGVDGLPQVTLVADPDLLAGLSGVETGNPVGVQVGPHHYVFSRSGCGAATPFCERGGERVALADIPPDHITELLRSLRGITLPDYVLTVALPGHLPAPAEHRQSIWFRWGTLDASSQRHCAGLEGWDYTPVLLPEGRWTDCPTDLRMALVTAIEGCTGRQGEPGELVSVLKEEALAYLRV